MGANIFWKPDDELINNFMETYVKDFDKSLGYRKWHYVKGFTKNCSYGSDEYKSDVMLAKKLKDAVMVFQKQYYPKLTVINTTKLKLSDKTTIFLYWHQGKDEMPKLQKLCYNRLLQKCSDNFNIILLDHESVGQYIDIPDFIEKAMEDKRMWLQHYVDYIRISLLAKYYAVWFDATIFVRDDLKNINFDYDFWSIKCKDMYANTWAKDVIPEMNNCQIYTMAGHSSYFYNAMKQLIEYHFKTFNVAYSYYMMYYLANYLYETDKTIKQQFDNLDYNNEHIECFANKRTLPLDEIEKLWKTTTDTHLFKLIKFKEEDMSDNAYKVYSFLKHIYEQNL